MPSLSLKAKERSDQSFSNSLDTVTEARHFRPSLIEEKFCARSMAFDSARDLSNLKFLLKKGTLRLKSCHFQYGKERNWPNFEIS